MLSLTLVKGIQFQLPGGGLIDMQIERINGDRVRVSIDLPRDVVALRTEVVERDKQAAKVEAKP